MQEWVAETLLHVDNLTPVERISPALKEKTLSYSNKRSDTPMRILMAILKPMATGE